MPIATIATATRRLCSPLLLTVALALLPALTSAADRTVTRAPPASAAGLRLPLVHLHGNALLGGDRSIQVDEIDRISLLVTWKILDPFKGSENRYTGIPLKDLVMAVAPKATHVRMRAIDDYVTVFARGEWESLPILLATRDGDSRMSVAHKGPARIVFRQTRENEVTMQVHAPQWIWQVVDVEFQSR